MRAFFCCVGAIVLWGCGEKLIAPPEDLIPKDTMVLIIKDMAVANAAKTNNLTKMKEYGIDPTQYVFGKYQIDSAQFVASDRYYASLPVTYEYIYAQVEEMLVKEAEQMAEDKKIQDSLNLLKKPKNIPGTIKTSKEAE